MNLFVYLNIAVTSRPSEKNRDKTQESASVSDSIDKLD